MAVPKKAFTPKKLRWLPWSKRLEELLGVPVRLEKDYLDGVSVKPGECVLCENVRFNKGEKKNNEEVARKLAALGDVYVMDAFATAHRAQLPPKGPSVSPRSPAWACSWPPNSKP